MHEGVSPRASHRRNRPLLTLFDNIIGLIDMRSFSSVWYWIVLALFWSRMSQFTLGVPYDVIMRARRNAGQDLADMTTLAGVHVRRKLELTRRAGHWVLAFFAGLLTLVFMLAFVYMLEFAQAVFLLLMPLVMVRLLDLRLALKIERENMHAERLARALLRHRLWVQVLGIIAIFVTAVWGMFVVMSRSVLGWGG